MFGGENSECVYQGLKDIFDYIGVVPPLIIFDNAIGIVKWIGDIIHESELLGAFRVHYNFYPISRALQSKICLLIKRNPS